MEWYHLFIAALLLLLVVCGLFVIDYYKCVIKVLRYEFKRSKAMVDISRDMLNLRFNSMSTAEYFTSNGYMRVIPYGVNTLCLLLLEDLLPSVSVPYIIDQAGSEASSPIEVVSLGEMDQYEEGDVYVVCLVDIFDAVSRDLRKHTKKPIVSLTDVIENSCTRNGTNESCTPPVIQKSA